MDSNKSNHEGNFIIGGIGLLFVYKLYEKFLLWYAMPRNKFIVIGSLALAAIPIIVFATHKIIKLRKKNKSNANVTKKTNDSVYCGESKDGRDIWIKPNQRAMHTQVIGTTNAGKTESVILPWAIQDINAGKGLLLIDGKADNSLLNKLWSYTVQANRQCDFKLFSLSNLSKSHQFNPLRGGSSEEIVERVFNSFDFENAHYKNLQYEVMMQVMRLFEASKTEVSFQRLHFAISNPKTLEYMAKTAKSEELNRWVQHFNLLDARERETRTSGLLTALSHFSYGERAKLFNPSIGGISIDEALKNNQIIYFQLPVLLSPFLGKATGKLILQSLQAAVANRHNNEGTNKFFSVFLDDFTEYLYEGFVTILNKSRSANVGIVFAHQALGDISGLGDSVANSILTNSNLKVFMRGNDPESAEYFSKVVGTIEGSKSTEREESGTFGSTKTGQASVRSVEQFPYHPNKFKRELGVGEAVMIIPHEKGAENLEIKFSKLDDLPPVPIPDFNKEVLSQFKFDLEKANNFSESPITDVFNH